MLRNVIFVAPSASYDVLRFLRALSKLEGTRLLGVFGKGSKEARALCDTLALVDDPFSVDDLSEAVRLLTRRYGRAHRIVGINEVLMVQLAKVRERFGVPGTPVKTATLFREKADMKDALRAAGLPVAAHALLTTEREARAFVERVGLPLVLKPPAGVGARSTYRVKTVSALLTALQVMDMRPGHPVLAEELLRGTEHSFETVTVAGRPRAVSFANYLPAASRCWRSPGCSGPVCCRKKSTRRSSRAPRQRGSPPSPRWASTTA